ncbi:MAG: MFS transporter [Candidatus Bathyarchaeota archaeon]|nr:MFS transporter [Candidatus Bathyarchaeota archaeon]
MNTLEWLRKEKQIAYFILATAFRGIRDNIRWVIWQPFALSLGLPMTSIGALSSLTEFSRIVIQPIIGAASDRYGRKRFLVLRDGLVVAACFCFLFAQSWVLLSVGMVLVGLNAAFMPVWQSTIAESTDSDNIGYLYSVIGSAYMITGMIGTISSGYITDLYGYRAAYGISTFFATLTLIVTTWKIGETKVSSGKGYSVRQAFGTLIETFKPPRYMWGYYIAMSVDLFAFSLGWGLINGMLTESYGFTPSMLGVLLTVNNLCMAVFQISLGKYVDKIGYVKCLIISQGISTILLGLLLINQSFIVVLIANMLMGVGAAFWGPAEQAWIANNVNPEERAQSIGGYSTFRGLVALPAPLIGGMLYDNFGYHVPVGVNMVIAFIDIFLLWWLVKDKVRPD